MNIVLGLVFWIFIAFVATLVISAFARKFGNVEEPAAEVPDICEKVTRECRAANVPPKPIPCLLSDHEWRHITEFVDRCKKCGDVQFTGAVPEGMDEYVRLMTSRRAKEFPLEESFHYKELDPRAAGPDCPYCERIIGYPEDLPRNPYYPAKQGGYRCPYCQNLVIWKVDGTGYEKI